MHMLNVLTGTVPISRFCIIKGFTEIIIIIVNIIVTIIILSLSLLLLSSLLLSLHQIAYLGKRDLPTHLYSHNPLRFFKYAFYKTWNFGQVLIIKKCVTQLILWFHFQSFQFWGNIKWWDIICTKYDIQHKCRDKWIIGHPLSIRPVFEQYPTHVL